MQQAATVTAADARPDAIQAEAFLIECTKRLDKQLEEDFSKRQKGVLIEAMRYACAGGGKRFRPGLVYASAEILNIPASAIDAIAGAVELIHTYSLIHDDLPAMDNDDLRRGRPAVHRAFDEATAILAGDALHDMAFEMIGRARQLSDGQKIKVYKSSLPQPALRVCRVAKCSICNSPVNDK